MAKNSKKPYYYKKNNFMNTPIFSKEDQQETKITEEKSILTLTTTHPLNLRKQASLQAGIIIVIPKDTKVVCQDCQNENWYCVKYENYTGFCMKEFLK